MPSSTFSVWPTHPQFGLTDNASLYHETLVARRLVVRFLGVFRSILPFKFRGRDAARITQLATVGSGFGLDGVGPARTASA